MPFPLSSNLHYSMCFFSRVMRSWIESESVRPRWVALTQYLAFLSTRLHLCSRNEQDFEKDATRVRDREFRRRVVLKGAREGPAIGRQADIQAGQEERSKQASKQAGQIRESRKRGRLQFALWSSLRNETADWRDGVFVPRGRKKRRRLRAILLMSASLWGRNALLIFLHRCTFSKCHEESY